MGLWKAILGASVGSKEFAQRHSEVVGLWRHVHDLLSGLPDADPEREQYLGYMPAFYSIIVNQNGWGNPGSSTGDVTTVDHLTGIASTLRYRAITTPAITNDAVDRLRASIAEWRIILEDADFDEKFATEFRSQINHLEWLLNSMDLLGARPVVEASKKVVGSGVIAMGAKPSFAKRIGTALAGVVAFVTLFHAGVDDTVGIIEGVGEMRDAVVELITPQKELEAPPEVKELPAGAAEVIDAATIEVDPPESPTSKDG
ncbi:hypothetical protein PDG61_20880 [Mycolicibacterium sp. BiH015]|uniref:hypothetical protein n=1 Tax=Mycolicibacterium sp. BiH015 TaxID=3018808 RepID=UPI0022DF019C|nr:hypothetical protein [Mycolicibacterium sp. BiH015]MDA2893382.1 hypothetical protein [Mycolicibacterium sp. BiH015]